MSKTYSIFISHCWDYNDSLINLKNLLNKEDGLVASYEEVIYRTLRKHFI